MADKLTIDPKALETLAHILKDAGLSEVTYEQGETKIKLSRTLSAAPAPALPLAVPSVVPQMSAPEAPEPSAASVPEVPKGTPINSPMVGTAYLAPDPDSPPFVSPGDTIKEGQTLLIVEAMKVMNPIRAPHSGVIREISISNASPVEFGEPLMYLDKSA